MALFEWNLVLIIHFYVFANLKKIKLQILHKKSINNFLNINLRFLYIKTILINNSLRLSYFIVILLK
jgi:hypothetical protein